MRCAFLGSSFLVVTLLAGCGSGAPRIDASSEANLKASLERIKGGMNDEERRQFATDSVAVMMPEVLKNASQGAAANTSAATPSQTETFKPLNGMTVAEIHAKAESIREAAKAKAKGK